VSERDDFPEGVKRVLASRVGYRCSRPGCLRETSGPQEDPTRAINIGVAAHITAASPGGPRYDAALGSERRAGQENGIWLCQTCAKLVDNDALHYSADLLRRWKQASEEFARLRLEDPGGPDLAFVDLEELMPALLDEVSADVGRNPTFREFILKTRASVYNSSRPLLEYYYDDYPALDQLMMVLEGRGLVRDITYNNTRRFALGEEFVRYLHRRRTSSPPKEGPTDSGSSA
jgi:hypothetical protein